MFKKFSLFFLIVIFLASLSGFYVYGRSIWHPQYLKLSGRKTVADVVEFYGEAARGRLNPYFRKAGVTYPAKRITLLAIKDEKRMELWGDNHFIRAYKVKAASGFAGPKLREGDRQVPEGHYKIIGLNPNSSYHLSMKLNYPNAFDMKYAEAEGRSSPGSNIFIHGKAASIGCLAMGDEVAEELFVLAHDVGIENIDVYIAPTDPRKKPLNYSGDLSWGEELYDSLNHVFSKFKENRLFIPGF